MQYLELVKIIHFTYTVLLVSVLYNPELMVFTAVSTVIRLNGTCMHTFAFLLHVVFIHNTANNMESDTHHSSPHAKTGTLRESKPPLIPIVTKRK